MAEDDRKYDIVLWGATGFTGQLVAEYLAERYDETELDWAIAGRNLEKLKKVREDLSEINQVWESLDILTGDAFDRPSLEAIAEQTAVICTTVGPYAKYGSSVVEACIECRTDYCDLAGELQWIQRMIDEYHEDARKKEVRIVNSCGFDSIPSDLGTLMVQNHAEETLGTACSDMKVFVTSRTFRLTEMLDTSSGGSIASLNGMYADGSKDLAIRRIIDNPYSLAPKGERSGPDEGRQRWPKYDSDTGQWTGAFIMAVINEKVVRRSNALLGYPWGRDFQYSEVMPTGSGISGAAVATGKSIGLALLTGLLAVSPARKLFDRFVLPNPGEGPSRELIEEISFEVCLLGSGPSVESESGVNVMGKVTGHRDPGYGATAWMLAESAICLAKGKTDTPLDGGVLTPASGIGTPLIDRLRDVGMTFTVDHHEIGEK